MPSSRTPKPRVKAIRINLRFGAYGDVTLQRTLESMRRDDRAKFIRDLVMAEWRRQRSEIRL